MALQQIHLNDILKRKNPYLFKAKNIELAQDFVKSIVDAFLSSQEETVFGNLLERFAIFVSTTTHNGKKSKFKSIDLEFEANDKYYIVGIKSGTNWGNADQINAMRNNFRTARLLLQSEFGVSNEIIAVNGCMYGTDASPFKTAEEPERAYYKYAGQEFWRFISDDDTLYQEIIIPINKEAKKKDEVFKEAYTRKINEMTAEFIDQFMVGNVIDWVKLIDFVSKRKSPDFKPPKAFGKQTTQ